MPMYDYACASCGYRFEVRQSIKDDPLQECPQCHGSVRRVIHAPGIVFKGSGFYKTDSRPSESKATGTTASETPAASGESKTAEAAPAAKAAEPAATKPAESKAAAPSTPPATS